jgi:hypothetical protein
MPGDILGVEIELGKPVAREKGMRLLSAKAVLPLVRAGYRSHRLIQDFRKADTRLFRAFLFGAWR